MDIYASSRSPALHHPAHLPQPDSQNIPASASAGSGAQFSGMSTRGNTTAYEDVVFLVGKRRQAYHVKAESLIRGSAYFRNLLQQGYSRAQAVGGRQMWPSLVMDCEEGIFESMLLLMRYGTFEALPPLSAAEAYQLKKEADFYGISYAEPSAAGPSSSSDSSSELSCCTSSSSSGSPRSSMNTSPPQTPRAGNGRHVHDGVRVSCTTPRQGLAELSEFPLDLADPKRLVLVSCVDAGNARFYSCACSSAGAATSAQWALSFHYRHAFCTGCGATTPSSMSAKHFSDMFMAAAAHYSTEQGAVLSAKWRVTSDSTCLLRLVSSPGHGTDACSCSGGSRATIWAATSFYSHAFCTFCSEAAKGPVLLSVMLALRFSGGSRGSKSARPAFTSQSLRQ